MKYKIIFLFAVLLICFTIVHAQVDKWDVYLAQYEKGAGSTTINISAKEKAPVHSLPYVVITGVTFSDCTSEGFPTGEQFSALYNISDSVQAIMNRTVKNEIVGTFTYQCQRLEYYYVNDTLTIRDKLQKMYSRQFKTYQPYITIKTDSSWEAYLQFLYPNEETYEYMLNQKVIMKLQEQGDELIKERKVDHWIYFKTVADRNCFEEYAKQNNFKIEAKDKGKSGSMPYSLQVSRIDKIDIDSISQLTLKLRKQAEKCNGDYDGWETVVVK
ncbi:DUF695 domain-containing protein [Ferruginibacter albus]|uniref:DUF695 domain-containing protein n=1 Tax=Ferruginibacter albus TaxID=2875540 RepID=UPI001CC73DD9|nr:DUF695 domain-containing protein [Ferruginibacter albus]UAY51637.1 DUF695 domain-containing protein [Ferruginibacter albus]